MPARDNQTDAARARNEGVGARRERCVLDHGLDWFRIGEKDEVSEPNNNESDPAARYRDDPRTTDELLRLVLTTDPDRDDDAYWELVRSLQYRLPGTIDQVEELSRSDHEASRAAAADVLGQSCVETKFCPARCTETLLLMLRQETTGSVLVSIICALGHMHDNRTIDPLSRLQSHPDERVRQAVVSSLCGFEDEQAVAVLLERSKDPDRDVRNWATFGLGSQIDVDTATIRSALFARLEDDDDEIRGEALVGLAVRGESGVVPALLKELSSLPSDVLRDWTLIQDAAEAVTEHATSSGAKEWLPALERLLKLEIVEPVKIQNAIKRCASVPNDATRRRPKRGPA